MDLSENTIERVCKIFGYLCVLEQKGIDYVSSIELARRVGATSYTVRKDISRLNLPGYSRRGYNVTMLKEDLGQRFNLNQKRKACIVGLGRLGMALLDYEKFQEDGFEIVAGFDSSINKLERIRTDIEVFPAGRIEDVVKQKNIEMGIIAIPAEQTQSVADKLIKAGVRGILNFSAARLDVPEEVMYMNIDFTNALRVISAKFMMQK